MGIKTSNDEMVTARDLSRNASQLIDKIQSGELEKAVITRHGTMVGVLVTVEHYEEMERMMKE
jgi:prevent-host-death family protein